MARYLLQLAPNPDSMLRDLNYFFFLSPCPLTLSIHPLFLAAAVITPAQILVNSCKDYYNGPLSWSHTSSFSSLPSCYR